MIALQAQTDNAKADLPWHGSDNPVDTGRKLNVHKTFRICPGRLLNVLCTFSLRSVSTGKTNWVVFFLTRETFTRFP